MKTTLCNGGKCKPLRASDVLGATAWWRFVEVVAVKPLFTWLTVSLKLAVYNLIRRPTLGVLAFACLATWHPGGWAGFARRCAGLEPPPPRPQHVANLSCIRSARLHAPNASGALFLRERSLARYPAE